MSGHHGTYGADFDRYVDRYDGSAVQKMKQHYWTAKQTILSRLKKKEDDHLIASDSELDAKLEVFYSIRMSCEDMLRCIENYQDYLCDLSQEENGLGRFLKDKGKSDKTQAGKMMAAVGRAQSYAAQQRLALRVPLVRLYSELDVFTCRAVRDTQDTVDLMEKARTEYRGSLLWMKNVSDELDPDVYKRLEKFRAVQAQVKKTKDRFDKYKLDCLQKIDLLAASRCNLFSQILANYQNCLVRFWDKTSKAHSTVSESFKGYQHYEFTVVKELAEPSRRLAQLTTTGRADSGGSDDGEEADKSENLKEDELIALDLAAEDEKGGNNFLAGLTASKSMEDLFRDSPEAEAHPGGKPGDSGMGGGASDDLSSLFMNDGLPPGLQHGSRKISGSGPGVEGGDLMNTLGRIGESEKDQKILSDLLMSSADGADLGGFSADWEHAFGSGVGIGQGIGQGAGESSSNSAQSSPMHAPKGSTHKGPMLPSQLLDLALTGNASAKSGGADGSLIDWTGAQKVKSLYQHQSQPSTTSGAKHTPVMQTNVGPLSNKSKLGPMGDASSGGGAGSKEDRISSWYRMFADIDPLESNPDAVGNPEDNNRNA